MASEKKISKPFNSELPVRIAFHEARSGARMSISEQKGAGLCAKDGDKKE